MRLSCFVCQFELTFSSYNSVDFELDIEQSRHTQVSVVKWWAELRKYSFVYSICLKDPATAIEISCSITYWYLYGPCLFPKKLKHLSFLLYESNIKK